MMALLASFIPWEWIAALGVAVSAALAMWFGGKRSAKSAAKFDALKDKVKAHEIRNEVENRIATERDAKQRLRDEWSR